MVRGEGACLVCGKPLIYYETARQMECVVCHRKFESYADCEDGHYVCDDCHAERGIQVIMEGCRKTVCKSNLGRSKINFTPSPPTVRNATLEDAGRILEIYDYYVKNTAITFEYDTPSLEEFKGRMRKIMSRYPYLVIERDGTIQGYAYAGTFVGRAAYDWSCEMTVYLDHDARKCGMGRKIYEVLENKLKEMGILNLYACIGYPQKNDEYLTTNSADFHEHLGYKKVGEFHKCGYKFGRWYHMIWMEKIIGEHTDNP